MQKKEKERKRKHESNIIRLTIYEKKIFISLCLGRNIIACYLMTST